jgi:hypothetical protein
VFHGGARNTEKSRSRTVLLILRPLASDEGLMLLGIQRGCIFCMNDSTGLWRAQQRSTAWRDHLLRSARVKS